MTDSDHVMIHASSVAINGLGILITGPSGSGKSDLALRLIDRGATLVSDDIVNLLTLDQQLVLRTPETIQGKMEVRSLGVLEFGFIDTVPLKLKVQLGQAGDRFPMDSQTDLIAGKKVSVISIDAFQHSAPIKVELALERAVQLDDGK